MAGLRVAVLRSPGFDAPVDADGIAAVEQAAQLLTDAGAERRGSGPRPARHRHALRHVVGHRARAWSCPNPETRRALLDSGLLDVAAPSRACTGPR